MRGWGGGFGLRGYAEVLEVWVEGEDEARRRAAMAHEGLDYKTAARMQQETDQARRAYVSHFYPRAGAWEDPRCYDLVLDSTAISLDACVDIIVLAAKDLFAKSAAAREPRAK